MLRLEVSEGSHVTVRKEFGSHSLALFLILRPDVNNSPHILITSLICLEDKIRQYTSLQRKKILDK